LYRAANLEAENARAKRYREANPGKNTARKKAYNERNPGKENERSRRWYQGNKDRARAKNNARDKRVRQATPPWASMADIRAVYEGCPKGHHVDHIIPIKGDGVSGLHVPWNLQYLTPRENIVKGNTYVPS
jgi:5-methylcytosine-specific restriction endonuclease McrA